VIAHAKGDGQLDVMSGRVNMLDATERINRRADVVAGFALATVACGTVNVPLKATGGHRVPPVRHSLGI
jgi:hypothetical protein